MVGGILGLIGVGISLFFSNKVSKDNQEFQRQLEKKHLEDEMWRRKYSILVQLISFRFDFASAETLSALNSISAIFYDSNEVMNATKDFYEYSILPDNKKNPEIANDKLVSLYMAMYKDLGIDQEIDRSFLKKTFLYNSNGN